ncbi:MAG: DUF2335 domain-containing protein [Acidimicrobiaceae bacterium]|nr:DUF2335 domain-containing protein [Acidimicrobiaceae bacterium]MDE0497810.1 DUF2335 domain-containing protein [Acidimicrobiaceae bacterium]
MSSDALPARTGSDDPGPRQSAQLSVERYEASYHIGPLPSPADLSAYGDISPELVLRIVDAADDERHHRHRMDAARVRRSVQGLIAGFAIAVLFLAGSVWLISNGYSVEGTVLGSIDLVALVALFVMSRRGSTG